MICSFARVVLSILQPFQCNCVLRYEYGASNHFIKIAQMTKVSAVPSAT